MVIILGIPFFLILTVNKIVVIKIVYVNVMRQFFKSNEGSVKQFIEKRL